MDKIFIVVTHTKDRWSSAGAYFYKNETLAEEKAAYFLANLDHVDSAEVVQLFDYDG